MRCVVVTGVPSGDFGNMVALIQDILFCTYSKYIWLLTACFHLANLVYKKLKTLMIYVAFYMHALHFKLSTQDLILKTSEVLGEIYLSKIQKRSKSHYFIILKDSEFRHTQSQVQYRFLFNCMIPNCSLYEMNVCETIFKKKQIPMRISGWKSLQLSIYNFITNYQIHN